MHHFIRFSRLGLLIPILTLQLFSACSGAKSDAQTAAGSCTTSTGSAGQTVTFSVKQCDADQTVFVADQPLDASQVTCDSSSKTLSLVVPALPSGNTSIRIGNGSKFETLCNNFMVASPKNNTNANCQCAAGETCQNNVCVLAPVTPTAPQAGCATDSDCISGKVCHAGACVEPVDSDGDGVADDHDDCPNTPAGTHVTANGCPDADKDGVQDANDACPNTPAGAHVDDRGCPDTDGDGVDDADDRCSNTPTHVAVDAYGCPSDVQLKLTHTQAWNENDPSSSTKFSTYRFDWTSVDVGGDLYLIGPMNRKAGDTDCATIASVHRSLVTDSYGNDVSNPLPSAGDVAAADGEICDSQTCPIQWSRHDLLTRPRGFGDAIMPAPSGAAPSPTAEPMCRIKLSKATGHLITRLLVKKGDFYLALKKPDGTWVTKKETVTLPDPAITVGANGFVMDRTLPQIKVEADFSDVDPDAALTIVPGCTSPDGNSIHASKNGTAHYRLICPLSSIFQNSSQSLSYLYGNLSIVATGIGSSKAKTYKVHLEAIIPTLTKGNMTCSDSGANPDRCWGKLNIDWTVSRHYMVQDETQAVIDQGNTVLPWAVSVQLKAHNSGPITGNSGPGVIVSPDEEIPGTLKTITTAGDSQGTFTVNRDNDHYSWYLEISDFNGTIVRSGDLSVPFDQSLDKVFSVDPYPAGVDISTQEMGIANQNGRTEVPTGVACHYSVSNKQCSGGLWGIGEDCKYNISFVSMEYAYKVRFENVKQIKSNCAGYWVLPTNSHQDADANTIITNLSTSAQDGGDSMEKSIYFHAKPYAISETCAFEATFWDGEVKSLGMRADCGSNSPPSSIDADDQEAHAKYYITSDREIIIPGSVNWHVAP